MHRRKNYFFSSAVKLSSRFFKKSQKNIQQIVEDFFVKLPKVPSLSKILAMSLSQG